MINLDKRKWKKVKFGEIAQKSKAKCNPVEDGITRFVAGGHIETDRLKIEGFGFVGKEYVGPSFTSKFYPNDVLYVSRRTYLRKVAVPHFEGVCANTTFVIQPKDDLIDKRLLPFLLQSPAFTNFSINNSKGSTNPFINFTDLKRFEFHLPPKPDQEKILSLFTTLEELIEASETQSHNLLQLKQKLLTDLLKEKPVFGNVLQISDCHKVTLQKVAKEMRQSEKNPLENGLTRFVSLSHIEAGKLKIADWGNIADGTTFTRKFEAGDVLFGRRRAYLKKAALADFEGLCSGDIIVLRAIAQQILPNLLPYYVSADAVFDFAVSQSAGSLSPRVKWKDLGKFDFWLPSKEIQAKIVEILQHLDALVDEVEQQSATLKELKQSLLDEILG